MVYIIAICGSRAWFRQNSMKSLGNWFLFDSVYLLPYVLYHKVSTLMPPRWWPAAWWLHASSCIFCLKKRVVYLCVSIPSKCLKSHSDWTNVSLKPIPKPVIGLEDGVEFWGQSFLNHVANQMERETVEKGEGRSVCWNPGKVFSVNGLEVRV